MDYVYGAALLFAASACYSAARIIYRNDAANLDQAKFGPAELIALVLTAITAGGLALMAQALASNWSLLGLAEGAAAIGVLVFAAVAAHRVIARALGRKDRSGLDDLALSGANQNRPAATDGIRAA